MSEVHRETGRRVEFLTAASSMNRKFVGFFARMMSSSKLIYCISCMVWALNVGIVPVARAADHAKPGTGRISLSKDDPCLVIGHGTLFKSELSPKWQIMLSKSLGSAIGEIVEVISDTELRIKKEFGGESGKATSRIRQKLQENSEKGETGLEYKRLPFIDQQKMYKFVYKRLTEGGCIGIFPEGWVLILELLALYTNFQ